MSVWGVLTTQEQFSLNFLSLPCHSLQGHCHWCLRNSLRVLGQPDQSTEQTHQESGFELWPYTLLHDLAQITSARKLRNRVALEARAVGGQTC